MDKNEIKEKLKKIKKTEELDELLIQIEEAELKNITDPDEYAMKVAIIENLRTQQMNKNAIKAAEQSEIKYRENQNTGNYQQNVDYKNKTEEIKKHNKR